MLQIMRFGAVLLISVFLARLISRELVGLYETLLLLGSSFTYFWVTGFINPFIPYYHRSTQEEAKWLIFNMFLLLTFCSSVIFILLISGVAILKPQNGDLYLLYFAANLFIAPSFLSEYILMVNNRPKSILVYGLFSNLLQAGAVIIPLYFDTSLHLSLWLLLIYSLLRYGFLLSLVIKYSILRIDKKQITSFLQSSFPYLLSLLVGGSMAYMDSYIIKFFYPNADFAVFRYGAREFAITVLMAAAFSNVKSGEVALGAKQNNLTVSLRDIRKGSERLMHFLFPVTIIFMVFSGFLFEKFYSVSFVYSAFIFNIYLLLTVSRLLFPQTALIGLQRNKTMLRLSIYEWCLNLIFDIVFLKLWGMAGVAFATVLAYYFEKVFLFYYCRREGIKFSDLVPVKTWVGYTILTLVVFCLVALFGTN